jgi:glycosyltransferase involved in cell wall biosynthesis
MRILYTLNSGKPGGMEQHVLDLVKGMVDLGYKTFVWCPDGEIVDWFKAAGAEVITTEIKWDLDPKYISRLSKFLRENKVSVLHAHELKAASNSLIAGFLAGTEVRVTHIHTPMTEWQVPNLFKKIITVIQTAAYSLQVNLFGTKEIALTESRKKVKQKEGIISGKLAVIPNGLDTEYFGTYFSDKPALGKEIRARYNIPDNAFVFGNLGRHTEEKGQATLIEAFGGFVNTTTDNQEYILLFAGGGKLEKEHKKLARKFKVADKVIFTGIFDDADKLGMYAAMDAFVHPTLAEGFGIVLMEAMYLEIPIIATNLPVLHEVGGDTVAFFEKGNVVHLVERMRALAHGEVVTFGSSKERVERLYTKEKFVQNYQNLYLELLKETLK